MHITDLLLRASSSATKAAEETRALPPVVVDPSAVDAVLSELPVLAAQGKRKDPDATTFTIALYDSHDRVHVALYAAVAERLRDAGIEPVQGTEALCGLRIHYQDLQAASELESERRAAWIAEAEKLWTAKAGPAATLTAKPTHDGVLLVFETSGQAAPAHDPIPFRWNDAGLRRSHAIGEDWPQHTAAAIVDQVCAALRPLSWSPTELEKLWKDLGGTAVTPAHGLWREGEFQRGAALTFLFTAANAADGRSYLISDVYTLTAEELIAKVASDMGMAPAKAEKKRSGKEAVR